MIHILTSPPRRWLPGVGPSPPPDVAMRPWTQVEVVRVADARVEVPELVQVAKQAVQMVMGG